MATQIIEKCLECDTEATGQAFFAPGTGERRLWCSQCDELTEPYATVLTLPESQPVTQSPPSYGRHGVGRED